MDIVKNDAGCPPSFNDEVTITFTGKELEFIRDSLGLSLKKYISRLHSHASANEFDIHYYDTDELIVYIHEIYTLLSDFDDIFEIKF